MANSALAVQRDSEFFEAKLLETVNERNLFHLGEFRLSGELSLLAILGIFFVFNCACEDHDD